MDPTCSCSTSRSAPSTRSPASVADELLKLFRSKRFAGLFITHSVSEAVYLSTRVMVMSARPGRIVADIAVPWDFPRESSLRYNPEFATLTGRVSQALGEHS